MGEEKTYTLKELKKKLTEKERIFCHQYIIDWNGSRSAREAGYSEKTAKEIAHATLTKVHIQQYINYIKDDFEKEAGISKLKQLNELAKIAYTSIAHMHETWIEKKEFDQLDEDQKAAIESIEYKTEQKKQWNQENESYDDIEIIFVKLKLYSKIAAMREVNQMMGYLAPSKFNHQSEDGSMSPKPIINVTSKEAAKELKKLIDD